MAAHRPELVVSGGGLDPVLLADSVGLAVLLEQLTPGERPAFVLHDLFEVPLGEVADIVSRLPPRGSPRAVRGGFDALVPGSGPKVVLRTGFGGTRPQTAERRPRCGCRVQGVSVEGN